jgi:sterol desaturase/sphingolipid hydroxylase (fatty acid hydroxylase superfamily)
MFWLMALRDILNRGGDLIISMACVVALEIVLRRKGQSPRSRLQAAVYWLIAIPATAVISLAFSRLWEPLGLKPLLFLDFGKGAPRWLWLAIAPVLGAVITDFFFYWFHRAEHRFLWRFHRVHHSIRELNALASYHHVTEELFRTLLMVAPMTLLVGYSAPGFAAVLFFFRLQGLYIHSASALHFGPLAYILADNRFHRIHHSTDPAHFNKNFTGCSPFWDVVFGTAYFPEHGEWPETGLADFAEPDGVAAYVLAPLRPLATSPVPPEARLADVSAR